MKLETKFLKPTFWTFLKYLTLSIIPFFGIATLLHIFTSPNPTEFKLSSWWMNFLLLPFGLAIGLTLGTRRVQLTILEITDLKKAKERALDFLLKNGLEIKSADQNETTLESKKGYNKLFGNWFGTELIKIKTIDNKLTVEGPFRVVDVVNSKLRSNGMILIEENTSSQ